MVDTAGVDRRKDLFVLTPFAAQSLLPAKIFVDTVPVANVHGGGARQANNGPVQGIDAPIFDVLGEDLECRFVKLDEIDSGRLKFSGFVVEDIGEGYSVGLIAT